MPFIAHADGIAFNWLNNQLYYTDATLDIVGVVDPVRLTNTILIRTGLNTNPRAIVLDPHSGYVKCGIRIIRLMLAHRDRPENEECVKSTAYVVSLLENNINNVC